MYDQGQESEESQITRKIRLYAPRNALVVTTKEDSPLAAMMAKSLEKQGIEATTVTEDHFAYALKALRERKYDVLVAGNGFDNLLSYVESSASRKSTFTVTNSPTGTADVRLNGSKELTDFVRAGKVSECYRTNPEAQQARAEEDSPRYKAIEQLMLQRALPQ